MVEFKRHFVRKRDLRNILNSFSRKFKVSLDSLPLNLKVVETTRISDLNVIFIDGNPKIVKTGDELYPTLFFSEVFNYMARVVVDMGAVPHICSGADVMAPGIVEINGEFTRGDVVLVIDERNRIPISIGKALLDSIEAREAKKGRVFKNLHYVGDQIWRLAKKQ